MLRKFLPKEVLGITALVIARDFGDSLEAVVLPWSVLSMFKSVLGAAVVFAIQSLPWVIIPAFTGYLIDVTSRRRLVSVVAVATQVVALVLITLIPQGSYLSFLITTTLFTLIIVVSVCDNIINYFVTVVIPRLVGRDEVKLQEINSKLSIASRIAKVLGFLAAGPLTYFLGLKALVVDAAVLTASLVPLTVFTPWVKLARVTTTEVSTLGSPKVGTSLPKFIKYLFIAVIPFNYAVGSWRIFVINSLSKLPNELGSISYSLINTSLILTSLLGSVIILKYVRKYGPKEFIKVGLIGESIFVASLTTLYLVSPSFIILTTTALATVSLLGLMDPLINVSLNSIFQSRIKEEVLGRVRGYFDSIATLAITASELTTAYLIQYVIPNTNYLPLIYSLICLTGALVSIEAIKKA